MTDTPTAKARLAAVVAALPNDLPFAVLTFPNAQGAPQIVSIGAPLPQVIRTLGAATAKIGSAMVPATP